MRLVVFGVGNILKKYINEIESCHQIVAFLDNDNKKQKETIRGIPVISPDNIMNLNFDKVVIMSDYAVEMRKQLLKLGISMDRIVYYKEYMRMLPMGLRPTKITKLKKKALVITSNVGYHGGAIVSIYLAQALNEMGYFVTIASLEVDSKLKEEISYDEIEIQECPYIQFSMKIDRNILNGYDFIIVNTFPMIMCALEISKYRDVVLWLHESDEAYHCMEYWKDYLISACKKTNIRIFAVSDIAKQCFEKNICKQKIEIFRYAIADRYKYYEKKKTNLSFAVVGTIYPLKRQLLFLEAIDMLKNCKKMQCDFYIVGKSVDREYFEKVYKKALKISNVKIVGELTRQQLYKFYEEVDVLVIPSEQETMSLIATEAMMFGKVCIITKNAGMASFINNRNNGIILDKCDKYEITEAIEFCINNRDLLEQMGKNARKTYEENFTLGKMESKLDEIILSN